jgi:hypothetical protein
MSFRTIVNFLKGTSFEATNVDDQDPTNGLPVQITAGEMDVNLTEVAGNNVATGNGAANSGTVRVTLATDSTGTIAMSQAAVTATKTRPNDTAVYASGDVVSDSTSAPTNFTFANAARAVGGGGVIIGASMSGSANQTIPGVFELWLWAVAPAATNDNAAMALSDTESNNVVAILEFDMIRVGNAAAAASGNVRYSVTNPVREFVCDAASTSLIGQLRVNNAYTPVAQEVFSITLQIAWR